MHAKAEGRQDNMTRLALAAAVVLGIVLTGLTARSLHAADPAEAVRDDDAPSVEVGAGTGGGILRLLGEPEVRIGISITDPDPAGDIRGARVAEVREESPAAAAGLRTGDVVTRFDGERVRGARHLTRLVSETPPGRAVPIVVQREGRDVELQVTPEQRPAGAWAERFRGGRFPMPHLRIDPRSPGERFEWDMPGLFDRRGRLGVVTQTLSPQLAEYFGAKEGVLVSTVRDDSPAARAGLRAGDVITALNGHPIASSGELATAVARAEGDEMTVTYLRERESRDVIVQLPAREGPIKRERSRPV